MNFILLSNDQLLPKIMKILLLKYWLKTGAHQRLNAAKDFEWLIYFQLCTGNKYIFLHEFDNFFKQPPFPKNHG